VAASSNRAVTCRSSSRSTTAHTRRHRLARIRSSSSIGAFAVDAATGKLTYLGSTPTEKQPRGFAIDPKGRYLVATGEKWETISVYAIDGSGALKPLGKAPTGKGANWVEIVSFD
jgi:6-phosphogluconolactonase